MHLKAAHDWWFWHAYPQPKVLDTMAHLGERPRDDNCPRNVAGLHGVVHKIYAREGHGERNRSTDVRRMKKRETNDRNRNSHNHSR
jgi:hypothetical protein